MWCAVLASGFADTVTSKNLDLFVLSQSVKKSMGIMVSMGIIRHPKEAEKDCTTIECEVIRR